MAETYQSADKYAESAERVLDSLRSLAASPDIPATEIDIANELLEAEKVERRAQLALKLQRMTGYKFEIYPQADLPGVAGFVYTNGSQVIHIAEELLDDVGFADHVAKHEANHLKTMMILPVHQDFTQEHLSVLNTYIPVGFENNQYYMEGYNEWLTSNQDDQGPEKTSYGPNVRAAQQLESLVFAATGVSLLHCFTHGLYNKFANAMKLATDRLMLHEALSKTSLSENEKLDLAPNIKEHDQPVDGPAKADLVVDVWVGKMEAEKAKAELLSRSEPTTLGKDLIKSALENVESRQLQPA